MSAAIDAGVQMQFRIGQRVRHTDYKGQRVTGVVRALSIDGEQGLMVSIALDTPIVIPEGPGYAAINIHTRHAQAHEFSPFDERDELIAEMRELLCSVHAIAQRHGADTAWDRLAASVQKLGIGAITARTYRLLPSDLQPERAA